MTRIRKTIFLLVFALVAADQLTKWLVETNLPFQEPVPVLPFFSLLRTYNTGIAFSMLSDFGNGGLIALTGIVLALIFWLWRNVTADQQLAHLGFALVVSGAIGNVIDRLTQGHVIDFLLLHTQNWAFAVFNLADAFITIGAIAIVIDEFFSPRRGGKAPTASSS